MTQYEVAKRQLKSAPRNWAISGAAGFIGSNLLETLLKLDQRVTGLDNFATGHERNLEEVKRLVEPAQWARFDFIEGDVCAIEDCARLCEGADTVLHHAALGSVPRSLADPIATNASNVTGFLNMLVAARNARVGRFVYASSSSTYGDHPALPKVEDAVGKVLPKWTAAMLEGREVTINGDGETSRDFCYVANAVQANLLADTTDNQDAINHVYNVADGERTSLNNLYAEIRRLLAPDHPHLREAKPKYGPFRAGDIRHSLADVSKARLLLGYEPTHRLAEGLKLALSCYVGSPRSPWPTAAVPHVE